MFLLKNRGPGSTMTTLGGNHAESTSQYPKPGHVLQVIALKPFWAWGPNFGDRPLALRGSAAQLQRSGARLQGSGVTLLGFGARLHRSGARLQGSRAKLLGSGAKL